MKFVREAVKTLPDFNMYEYLKDKYGKHKNWNDIENRIALEKDFSFRINNNRLGGAELIWLSDKLGIEAMHLQKIQDEVLPAFSKKIRAAINDYKNSSN